jgi:hypothetical protein
MTRFLFSLILLSAVAGCASQSELTARRLDRDHPKYKTSGCQDSLSAAEAHRDIKKVRTIASPVLLYLSGGLMLPLVAANAGFDTVDHVDAARMAENCGARAQSNSEIATDVALGAAVGVATSGLAGTGLKAK